MKLIKETAEFILDIPARIIYMFRNWEYVDWRVQLAFYIILFLLMVGTLAVIQGKV